MEGQGKDRPLEPLRECQHLDFSPVKMTSDSAFQNSKNSIVFVGSCYGHNRKPAQLPCLSLSELLNSCSGLERAAQSGVTEEQVAKSSGAANTALLLCNSVRLQSIKLINS